MLVSRKDPGRKAIIQLSAIAIGIVSFLVLLFGYDKGTLIFSIDPDPVSQIMFFIELVLAAYILYLAYPAPEIINCFSDPFTGWSASLF